MRLQFACALALVVPRLFLAACAAGEGPTNAPPHDLLLIGPREDLVPVPTNAVPRKLLPPPALGMKSQIPSPARGLSVPEPVWRRLHESREGKDEFEWFPAFQPPLLPYLAAQDEFGNTAIKPGGLTPATPLDSLPQHGKSWLSEVGLRYSLAQTFTFVNMTDVMQGDNVVGFYSFDFAGTWAVFNAPNAGTAGWISAQIEAQAGLGANGKTQDAGGNLGTLSDPTAIWRSVDGFRIPELAWQQSLRDGELVVGTGFIMKGPLKHAGLLPGREHDAAGLGFVWSQPSATSTPVAHENESVLEAGYVLQLTPTMKLQPDVQVVWNPRPSTLKATAPWCSSSSSTWSGDRHGTPLHCCTPRLEICTS